MKSPKVKIVKGERRLNKVRIDMKNVPWENWNDIYNEVIDPLVQEGAEVLLPGHRDRPRGCCHQGEHGGIGHQGIAEPARDYGGHSDGVNTNELQILWDRLSSYRTQATNNVSFPY